MNARSGDSCKGLQRVKSHGRDLAPEHFEVKYKENYNLIFLYKSDFNMLFSVTHILLHMITYAKK